MSLHLISSHTPDGDFHIITDGNFIARASGFGVIDDLIKRLPKKLHSLTLKETTDHPYQSLVANYYNGDAQALNAIPHFQTGTDFQEKVWAAMSTIPYGETISYKQLAEASGNSAAIRAAGTICGLNRLILLVPCHRVLKSDGGIGSYLYGPTIKESLLHREGAV